MPKLLRWRNSVHGQQEEMTQARAQRCTRRANITTLHSNCRSQTQNESRGIHVYWFLNLPPFEFDIRQLNGAIVTVCFQIKCHLNIINVFWFWIIVYCLKRFRFATYWIANIKNWAVVLHLMCVTDTTIKSLQSSSMWMR